MVEVSKFCSRKITTQKIFKFSETRRGYKRS